MVEAAEALEEPGIMTQDFSVRGYYGTLNHNSKAVYQHYFGWWDGIPAHFYQHPTQARASRFVDMLGGMSVVLEKGREAFQRGDYRWAAEILNHAVFAADNKGARAWLAASYEQLGFQSESGAWRSYFLSGARELREGIPTVGELPSGNPEFLSAVSTVDLFDALATRYVPERIQRSPYELNFKLTDTGETLLLQVGRTTAAPRPNHQSESAAATITTTRRRLDQIVLGKTELEDLVDARQFVVEGDLDAVNTYFRALENPKFWFDIVTP